MDNPMKVFRLTIAAAATVAAVACAKTEKAPADSVTQPASASAAGPAPFSLAEAAGKWQMRSVPVSGDTTSNHYVMTATPDTTGWNISYTAGVLVPLHVTVSGDSVLLMTDIYSSQRRKGVKVMTIGSARLVDGKWVGTTTAHYQGVKDSILVLRIEGTRIP